MRTARHLPALVLLAGCLAGFGGAAVVGYQASGYSKPSHFKRFHHSLSPETNFFPTFTMMEKLALARWQPGRTVVIVGGNSIFNGVGQPEAELWTERLQEELGDKFVVVNFAFRGAYASEGGALVAESLLRRGVPVVYVADNGPGNCGRPFGSTYGYLFWDAVGRDRLLPFPERDKFLADWLRKLPPAQRTKQEELRRAAALDRRLNFQALWHHVGYRHVFTVWNTLAPGWWRGRDRFPDPERGPGPVAERFRGSLEGELNVVRGYTELYAEPNRQGGFVPHPPALRSLDEEIDSVFPSALRPRMLMLLVQSCPFYREKLNPPELARDELIFRAYRDKWREKGIAAAIVGEDFASDDFVDRCHLGPSGGRKLAHHAAGEIRAIAARLP